MKAGNVRKRRVPGPQPWIAGGAGAGILGSLLILTQYGVLGSGLSGLSGAGFELLGDAVGGGGVSSGGSYVLTGRVPVPAVGASAGGSYTLTGGLFPAPRLPQTVLPIGAVFTADKLVELSWPAGFEGYVLEFSPRVGPDADWQPTVPQPTGNTFLTPCQQPARYFRLRRP